MLRHVSYLTGVMLFWAARSVFAAEVAYPRPELLIEPAELAKPEVAKQVVILDARSLTKYKAGHVSNAVWVDHEQWAKAFGDGKDAEGWSKRIGALGIDANSNVVVYDDASAKDAARIWWLLRYWGLERVRILNGGWIGWQAGKFPTETSVKQPAATTFTAKARVERLATKDQLLASIKNGQLQIIDARSEKEFCGTEKLSNKRAGAIPSAKQLEWIDLLDRETQRFKSPSELRKLFADAGIALDKPSATHCQSGGRAAVMMFGMELMGAKSVGNYYASWAEWGNADDTPVVPGKPRSTKE